MIPTTSGPLQLLFRRPQAQAEAEAQAEAQAHTSEVIDVAVVDLLVLLHVPVGDVTVLLGCDGGGSSGGLVPAPRRRSALRSAHHTTRRIQAG